MDDNRQKERDYETFRLLIDLWKQENPIKTNKLQVLLLVNAILVSAVQIKGGFVLDNWPIYIAGCIFSLIWFFSIGRTSLFQRVWQKKAMSIMKRYPDDERFRVLCAEAEERMSPFYLRLAGSVSSKYYLIGAPLIFFMVWLIVLIVSMV